MEVRLPTCYVGAAGSHCRSHVHQTPHLYGMEPREGMKKKIPLRVNAGSKQLFDMGVILNVFVCGVLFSRVWQQFSQLFETALGSMAKRHVAS